MQYINVEKNVLTYATRIEEIAGGIEDVHRLNNKCLVDNDFKQNLKET